MLSALTSLLSRDNVLSVAKIEEALERQVVVGGEIETVLLEMALVPEDVLAAYRAALVGLPPTKRDEVMRADLEALKIVPRSIAERHRIVPIGKTANVLVVASSAPLAREVEHELTTSLGVALETRIACEVRIAAGLRVHYGVEIAPRLGQLADTLERTPAGVAPSIAPPMPRSRRPSALPRSFDDDDDRVVKAVPRTAAVPQLSPPLAPLGLAPLPRPEPAVPTLTLAASAATSTEPRSVESRLTPLTTSDGPPIVTNVAAQPNAVRDQWLEAPGAVRPEWVRRLARAALMPRAHRELLDEAETRDEVLLVFFAFARQFFEHTSLILVQGPRLHVRFGEVRSGALEQATTAVPLVSRTVTTGEVVRHDPINAAPEDAVWLRAIGHDATSSSVLVPVVISGRPVLILVGDGGGAPVDDSEITDLLDSREIVARALERLIRQRKGGTRSFAPPPPNGGAPGLGPGVAMAEIRAISEQPPAATSSLVPAKARRGARALEILPVPRSAPPPPIVGMPAVRIAPLPATPFDDERPTEPDHPIPPGGSAPRPRVGDATRLSMPPPATREVPAGREIMGTPAVRQVDRGFGAPTPARISIPPEERVSPSGSYSLSASQTDVVRRSDRPPDPNAQESTPRRASERPPRETRPLDVAPREPSIIVDMCEGVSKLVDALARSSRDEAPPRIDAVIALGEAALPVLVQRFPGPLWVDAWLARRRPPPAGEISGIARALVAFRERAAPYVAPLLDTADEEVRFFALCLAREMPHPTMIDPLSRRIFDTGQGIPELALASLQSCARFSEIARTLEAFRAIAKAPSKETRRRSQAIVALGAMRDPNAVPALIASIGDSAPDVRAAAARALVSITRQTFGENVAEWLAWFETHGRAHRIEWLIDALVHAEESIRTDASDELKRLTQQYFGYHPTQPRRDRERVRKRYQEWWAAEGRARFSG